MGIRKILWCICTIFLNVGGSLVSITNRTELNEIERRVIATYNVVDYMARRPEQMNMDAVFGLTLAEAHLRAVMAHRNSYLFPKNLMETLKNLSEICRLARIKMMSIVSPKDEEHGIINEVLNKPERWMKKINWSHGKLGPRPKPSPGISLQKVSKAFHQGTPQEEASDACLSELARQSLNSHCQVSDFCAEMLFKNDNTRGYPLTHRLLYVQTAVALGCKEHPSTRFSRLIPAYCKAVLQDTVDMEFMGLPLMARDMITEQVLLCGMEGFTEFANQHYAGLILSWPNSFGCFSAFGFEEKKGVRFKRETEGTDYGCDNHATSLGAASLALLIRQYIEKSH